MSRQSPAVASRSAQAIGALQASPRAAGNIVARHCAECSANLQDSWTRPPRTENGTSHHTRKAGGVSTPEAGFLSDNGASAFQRGSDVGNRGGGAGPACWDGGAATSPA